MPHLIFTGAIVKTELPMDRSAYARVLSASVLLMLMLLVGSPRSARAQDAAPGFRTIGYVVNAPIQLVGLHFSQASRGRLGWFGDFKLTVFLEPEESIFYDVPRSGVPGDDEFDSDRISRNSLNGGVTFGLSDRFFLYAGVGGQQRTRYLRYRNVTRIIGRSADFYWITDQGFGVNALGGFGLRVHRYVTVVLGAEANPAGVTIGAGYAMPINNGS